MNITLLEPYFAGSHAAWSTEYKARSRHQVDIITLPGRHWKWRMHGGAVTLARRFLDAALKPDLLLASDMLDLTTFLALTRSSTAQCRSALYFHENQLTYPWSPTDCDTTHQREMHYAFINYASALAADAVLFNSHFHMGAFLREMPGFLNAFPDQNEPASIKRIGARSSVLPLGMDLQSLDQFRQPRKGRAEGGKPLILWNHRWEYDKNPDAFFRLLIQLAEEGYSFEVAVLGESFGKQPPIFAEARQRLGSRVVHWGFLHDFAEYAAWLWQADILPVTSQHDFFGGSVVQAIYSGCTPLLPNRLAYPEHIPAELHASFLYENEEELGGRLRELLSHPREDAGTALREHVSHYDWGVMAPLYDRFFESLAEGDVARN